MNKKHDKRWQLYQDCVKYIQDILGLGIWGFTLSGIEGLEVRARIKDIDYSHFQSEIEFNNKIIFDGVVKDNFKEIFSLFTHEVCHIFTSCGEGYFNDNEHNIKLNISQKEYVLILNSITFSSEQMTNILHKIIVKFLENTKEYKNFEKIFNKLK